MPFASQRNASVFLPGRLCSIADTVAGWELATGIVSGKTTANSESAAMASWMSWISPAHRVFLEPCLASRLCTTCTHSMFKFKLQFQGVQFDAPRLLHGERAANVSSESSESCPDAAHLLLGFWLNFRCGAVFIFGICLTLFRGSQIAWFSLSLRMKGTWLGWPLHFPGLRDRLGALHTSTQRRHSLTCGANCTSHWREVPQKDQPWEENLFGRKTIAAIVLFILPRKICFGRKWVAQRSCTLWMAVSRERCTVYFFIAVKTFGHLSDEVLEAAVQLFCTVWWRYPHGPRTRVVHKGCVSSLQFCSAGLPVWSVVCFGSTVVLTW